MERACQTGEEGVLRLYFKVVGKPVVAVTPADVFGFITAQRTGSGSLPAGGGAGGAGGGVVADAASTVVDDQRFVWVLGCAG